MPESLTGFSVLFPGDEKKIKNAIIKITIDNGGTKFLINPGPPRKERGYRQNRG
jgi:hypothetical protein